MYTIPSSGQYPYMLINDTATTTKKEELTTVQKVLGLAGNQLAQSLAAEQGLSIQTVSWEDTVRNKNSCWGPNISDMTLQVTGKDGLDNAMPVIRQPNFSDKTTDISIDQIFLMVGNEKGADLNKISLKEYLNAFASYVDKGSVKGNLYCERDEKIIQSVQACFLPAEEGEEVAFNVALFNYQSYAGNPAVLVLVASAQGTSAQIMDEGYGQKLTFNKNGKSCDFVAERLKDVRAKEGWHIPIAELNKEEKDNRQLLIVQIPLKVAPRPPFNFDGMSERGFLCGEMDLESEISVPWSAQSDMDDAQIKIGAEKGPFDGLKGLTIERDERYPIRVTHQIYKITNDGVISREQMEKIAAEIKEIEAIGQNASSLVLEKTERPTEWIKS